MNFMKKMLVISLSYSMSYGILFADVPQSAMPATAVSQQKNQARGKVLTCPEMSMLNAIFATESGALGILRLNLALKSALQVLKTLPTIADNDQRAVGDQIRFVLSPVKEFFAIIQQYSYMIKPLVEESLVGKTEETGICKVPTMAAGRGIINNRQCLDAEQNKPLILRFMLATDGVNDFFEKNVATKDQLYDACMEFCTFFEDLNRSLTPAAVESYKALIAQLRSEKKR